ncbi:MAG: zinc ABC transporter substrate-binding protein, partial [Gemmatimonadota bacterium]|nr:zinc ABC transporter substrate-binding protein [Gemmatimonadota bacterium]
VDVLLGPGRSPATYEPGPRQMSRMDRAEVFFGIGVPFEKPLIENISRIHGHLKIIDTSQGIKLRRIEVFYSAYSAAPESSRHIRKSGAPDPHIWLDPKLVKVQAATICRELCRLDPEGTEQYRKNLELFTVRLDSLDALITAMFAPYRDRERKFFVYHPSLGYFADSYGLVQVPVEAEGKQPSARQLAGLIGRLERMQIKAVFVQPQFSEIVARALERTLGARVITFDPLSRDYFSNLEEIAGKLEKYFQGRAAGSF